LIPPAGQKLLTTISNNGEDAFVAYQNWYQGFSQYSSIKYYEPSALDIITDYENRSLDRILSLKVDPLFKSPVHLGTDTSSRRTLSKHPILASSILGKRSWETEENKSKNKR